MVLQYFFPFLSNIACGKTWLTPPPIICKSIFLSLKIIFGILLWKADEVGDTLLFAFVWTLFVINFSWVYFYKNRERTSLVLLFLCLLFGYFVYNSIFLSEITRSRDIVTGTPNTMSESTPLYLNLFSFYIIWIGLMITILIESNTFEIDRKLKKHLKYINIPRS